MIEKTYPSLKPAVVLTLPNTFPSLELAEYNRRLARVSFLSHTCPYKVGDVVEKETPDNQDTGTITVRHIVKHYSEIQKDEWPKTDNPMIVSLKYEKFPDLVMVCTTNYVKLKKGVIC